MSQAETESESLPERQGVRPDEDIFKHIQALVKQAESLSRGQSASQGATKAESQTEHQGWDDWCETPPSKTWGSVASTAEAVDPSDFDMPSPDLLDLANERVVSTTARLRATIVEVDRMLAEIDAM